MTEEQRPTRRDQKPSLRSPFAAAMGAAAAVASLALGVVSTIPGMKWLSAVSLHNSDALDWRLGSLNTYAAMHMRLFGSGTIDSGLGPEKVSASVQIPPTLLTVLIVLCLLGAATLAVRRSGKEYLERLHVCCFEVGFGFLLVIVLASQFAQARLDTIALPSTPEVSFSPPPVIYGVDIAGTAIRTALYFLPLLAAMALTLVPPWRDTINPKSPNYNLSGRLSVSQAAGRAVLCVNLVSLLVVLLFAGIFLAHDQAATPDESGGSTGPRWTSSLVPAGVVGFQALLGGDIRVEALGIDVESREENALLKLRAGLGNGIRVATNNGEDVKRSPVPAWIPCILLLAWAVTYFVLGRRLSRWSTGISLRPLIRSVLLWTGVTVYYMGALTMSELTRTDAGTAKSVIKIFTDLSWLFLAVIIVIGLATYIGVLSSRKRPS